MAEMDYLQRLKTLGRNDACGCGSGKKYKKCHLEADEKAQSGDLAKINAASAAKAKEETEDPGHGTPGHVHEHTHRHEKGGPARPNTSSNTSRQISAPRKTGA
jgi:hypothetical protein